MEIPTFLLFKICLCIVGLLDCYASVTHNLDDCPCSDPSYSNRITTPERKEVLGYAVNLTYYKQFQWRKLTTIVVYEKSLNEVGVEVVCLAHKYGVRVLIATSVSEETLLNRTARVENIQYYYKLAEKYYMDGANIDIEMSTKSIDLRRALTQYVKETKQMFSAHYPYSYVVTDVFWLPNIYHDTWDVAKYSDFLFIMAYDEQANMLPPCVAKANSPYFKTETGAGLFELIGIPGNKLVLGLPWYGYQYSCTKLDNNRWCFIQTKRGQCTQTVGTEIVYSRIRNILPSSVDGEHWSHVYKSPYLNYKGSESMVQVWYDNAKSLRLKYDIAARLNLRGVGVWTIDSLNYANVSDPTTKDMWDALPTP